jgi:Fur family zinc uptake transcriptional regulator
MTTPKPPVGFSHHDHKACISSAVESAEQKCRDAGLQFTTVRKRVLEILLEEHRAMGAYDVLDRLRAEGLGSQPPIAYRALDFLTKHGFVHKIERLNAFIACNHTDSIHTPAFLICNSCNFVAETKTDQSQGRLAQFASSNGFVIEQTVLEAVGICPNCEAETRT